jgi:peptidoglycan/LPS O-acetylase OafA/YrhL
MRRLVKLCGYIAILFCLVLLYTTKDYDFVNMVAAMFLIVIVAILMYTLEELN